MEKENIKEKQCQFNVTCLQEIEVIASFISSYT